MKPINENEFEIWNAPIIGEHLGIVLRAKTGLAALGGIFRLRYDMEGLPARLRRDAGMDELDIERKRLARAPLIR
jgi:hypothetical protein